MIMESDKPTVKAALENFVSVCDSSPPVDFINNIGKACTVARKALEKPARGMTIEDLVAEYIRETIENMNVTDLESFAKRMMTEAMEDLSDQEIIHEISDGCYSHLADEYDEANEDEVNIPHYSPNMNGGTYR